jgi:hypothetical protein
MFATTVHDFESSFCRHEAFKTMGPLFISWRELKYFDLSFNFWGAI